MLDECPENAARLSTRSEKTARWLSQQLLTRRRHKFTVGRAQSSAGPDSLFAASYAAGPAVVAGWPGPIWLTGCGAVDRCVTMPGIRLLSDPTQKKAKHEYQNQLANRQH